MPRARLNAGGTPDGTVDCHGVARTDNRNQIAAVGHAHGKHHALTLAGGTLRTDGSAHLGRNANTPTVGVDLLHHLPEQHAVGRGVLETARNDVKMYHLVKQHALELKLVKVVIIADTDDITARASGKQLVLVTP